MDDQCPLGRALLGRLEPPRRRAADRLGNLNALDYDPSTGTLVAGPAARGGLDVAPFLAERGRAFPVGHCPGVGLGGYLLQGGQGWNGRRMGWACESVLAVDVVTADGDLVRADATRHSDLYWAARGAGPGFPGIVTAFHLRTYPVPAVMWHDTRSFDPDDAAVLLGWMHEILPALDRRVEPVIAATRLSGELVLLLHTTVMADSEQEAAELLRVFADGPLAGRELGQVTAPTTVDEECVVQAEQSPEGYRYAVDCTWTDAPADVLAPPLSRLWNELDTRHSFSIWYGWAPDRPPRRQDRFLTDGNYRRLEEIRAEWDPSGVFASYLTADPEGLNVHD
jgi:hypothetical protein